MTKNRTMRVAVLMLALTLITSSFVGGTFAKYITKDEGADTARVAKWGIELSVTGDEDTFVQEYTGTNGAITVKSQDEDDLVAPGTQNDTGVTFTIKGNPEVASKVSVTLGETKDVFLKYDDNGVDAIYNPVVFTLTHTYGAGAYSIAPAVENTGATVVAEDGKDTVTGTLAQIEAVLANLTTSMTQVNPGYTFDDEFKLTWAWAFDGATSSYSSDTRDTILGDLAAGVNPDGLVDGTDYNLTVAYDFDITVEQVD